MRNILKHSEDKLEENAVPKVNSWRCDSMRFDEMGSDSIESGTCWKNWGRLSWSKARGGGFNPRGQRLEMADSTLADKG